MARLIGSQANTGNFGEDYLCNKLAQCFDDSCIIYRNKDVFGREFDAAMLIPNVGIVIFEAKGWVEASFVRIDNSDTIVTRVFDPDSKEEAELPHRPQKQVKGYRFAVEQRIRQATGKFPLVFTMVALPNISRDFYSANRFDAVLEEENTLLKEDFESKSSLYEKINCAISNVRNWKRNDFDEALMLEVRSIFETDLSAVTAQATSEYDKALARKHMYSAFYYIKAKDAAYSNTLLNIAAQYGSGVKIYAVVESHEMLTDIASAIDQTLTDKQLVRQKENVSINLGGMQQHFPHLCDVKDTFTAFNIAVSTLSSADACADIDSFCVFDGDAITADKMKALVRLSERSEFNAEQYFVEHADPLKGVIIRAGAGTGKTYTMISRINFVRYKQNIPLIDLADRMVMITFTNEAAEQMFQRLKAHFRNCYLITADTNYLSLIAKIDFMQISTIHAYAKSLISKLGIEFGYGIDVAITSTQYHRKKKVSAMLDQFIEVKRREQGEAYLSRLGMPVYALRDNIIDFISKLHNKSIDITAIDSSAFGTLEGGAEGQELHELLAAIIPQVEKDYASELLGQNKVHLNSMMSILNNFLQSPQSKARIKQLQKGKPQFMFVDEFQDTDDTQIEMLTTIAELLDYNLFLVGDIKQCIYRFRGAKEKAFDKVKAMSSSDNWNEFVLKRNYRSDIHLLHAFDCSFKAWGAGQGELLSYQPQSDRLMGVKHYNTGLPIKKYYTNIPIGDEALRLPALFEEVQRLGRRVKHDLEHGKKLSAKEKSIAILVRDNWQAELIRKEGAKLALKIHTNTGGDLYQSTPALDMLVLVNALLYFDEADYLYELAASNFFALAIPKSTLYAQRKALSDTGWRNAKADEKVQANYLIGAMNTLLSQSKSDGKWEDIVKSLRVKPILQVLREIYSTLRPWQRFSDDLWKQQYYKLNVDLLFEQVLSACNPDRLTINTLADYLFNSIVGRLSVDSRTPPMDEDDMPIQCVTVHKAKGLEYGHVVLPFTSFPIDMVKNASLHVSAYRENGHDCIGYRIQYGEGRDYIQNSYYNEYTERTERSREETRVLYVAMTRAIRSFSWITLSDKRNLSWQNLIQGADQIGI